MHRRQGSGVVLIYDGAELRTLRDPVAKRIQQLFSRPFTAEDETQEGEMYMDCVAVDPDFQGRGIGAKLIQWVIGHYHVGQNKTIGLLVDYDNPRAKKLYLSLGFDKVGRKTLVGKQLEHLQIKMK
jgi:ribosomal protein S18 acetylase RimI-like enzyme